MIEDFLKAHQHTFAAIGAVSTFAAVVTSLGLALLAIRADRTRLRAWANLVSVVHPTIDSKNAPEYLRVSIINRGRLPLRIPATFFYWKVPFSREVMAITPPLDFGFVSPLIAKKHYPTEIAPRASDYFFLSDLATFEGVVKRMRGSATLD